MSPIKADVAILGSGFAGSLCALILHRLGLKPVVFDRAAHPRFAIGESSTPTADMILRDLADAYDLPRLRPLSAYGPWQETYPHVVAGKKRGFSYFHHRPDRPFSASDAHENELLVAASNDDYWSDTHWLRADVDAFFADNVRSAGIPLFENADVKPHPRDDVWHLVARLAETELRCTARFVIDATGPAGVVPHALSLPAEPAPFHTHSRALFSHFTGVRPWHDLLAAQDARVTDHPFVCDDAALHHVLDGAWLWQLRFNNDLVSAGLVLDALRHPPDPADPPEQEWTRWLARYPSLHEQFAGARIAEPPGGLVRTGRLQRRYAHLAGPTWALLPHSAGFIDPLHSTGIAHTLCGIERLMGIVAAHWQRPGWTAALRRYEQRVLRELALVDRLIDTCYTALPSFRLFTASTMLYFAAVISYERARSARTADPSTIFERAFLCADDTAVFGLVAEAHARLRTLPRPVSPAAVAGFEAYVEQAIRPYNTAGLFHPPVPNMYPHTAAPSGGVAVRARRDG